MYKTVVKPFLDFFLGTILLLVLLPLLFAITVVLAIVLKGNPFFVQKRPGKNAVIFSIIKFRTMSNERDTNGNLLPDEQRLSSFGKVIRSASLDELPQLINVIKGSMSFVGPRPLLPEYLLLYNNEQQKRHEVRPGITGWAQVNGRNAVSWEKKFKMDVYYTERISFALDMKILLKTALKVLGRKDINTVGSATTEPFRGN